MLMLDIERHGSYLALLGLVGGMCFVESVRGQWGQSSQPHGGEVNSAFVALIMCSRYSSEVLQVHVYEHDTLHAMKGLTVA